MAGGAPVNTLDTLIKYTMSKELAERVKTRFIDMGINGEAVSYLDCVYFDTALAVLGEEQAYYGYGDEDWAKILAERAETEKRYRVVTVDVTKELEEAAKDEDRN